VNRTRAKEKDPIRNLARADRGTIGSCQECRETPRPRPLFPAPGFESIKILALECRKQRLGEETKNAEETQRRTPREGSKERREKAAKNAEETQSLTPLVSSAASITYSLLNLLQSPKSPRLNLLDALEPLTVTKCRENQMWRNPNSWTPRARGFCAQGLGSTV